MIPPRDVKHSLLLLIYIAGGDKSSVKARHTYDILADVHSLPPSEREEERDKNQGRVWHSTVQNARKALVEEHFLEPLDRVERGEWQLTVKGRSKAIELLRIEYKTAAAVRARLGQHD